MTDNITLHRAVAEQIRQALVSGKRLYAAIAAIDAALAEPEQPQKARPDFLAGYDAGLADGRRIAERDAQDARDAAIVAAALAEPDAIAELFTQFAAKQKPLDADMAAIINANLDSLYITDEPAAAPPEPVHPGYIIGSHWLETAYSRIAAGEAEDTVLAEVLGARGWAKREPATAAEIVKAGGECAVVDDEYLLDFRDGWRAAERFHGIRKEYNT